MWDGQDRRKFPRAEYPCLITITKGKLPAESILTHTKSIGAGGVCVIIGKKIELMTEVDLELDLKDASSTIISKGKVSWVKEIPPTQQGKPSDYHIGIQFTGLSDDGKRRIKKIISNIEL